jgi:hypothetical protein
MIDKIEAMVERGTSFRGELDELRRASPWDPYFPALRPSKFYKAVADLRPFGFDAMLHIDQKRYGTHKVELIETGKKGMEEIESTLERIVDCDPGGCRLGRIDLAADVRDVPLSWFREHTFVQYKQFLCAHSKFAEAEFSEMGKKVYQTLYFGKRPSCIRIYDKVAERIAHFELWKKREIRAAKKSWLKGLEGRQRGSEGVGPLRLPDFPTVQEFLRVELPEIQSELGASVPQQPDLLPGTSLPKQPVLNFPVVTRVENQFGGRVPESLETIGEMRKNALDFNPFARMKIVAGQTIPPGLFDRDATGRYRFSVPNWCFCMFVHQNWNLVGASQMRQMLNRDRNGKRYLERMGEFVPDGESECVGVSESELYERYRSSITRQLAA